MREETLQEEFEGIANKIENEGLGYYLMYYTDSSSMPDEKSKKLFDEAVKGLNNFTAYVEAMAKEEEIVKSKKEYLMGAVDDLVLDLVYYNRKEDEDLSREDVDEMFRNGEVTPKEIIDAFSKELNKYCEVLGVDELNEKEQKMTHMTQKVFDEIENSWERIWDDKKRWDFLKENQHLGLLVNLDNDDTFVTHEDIEDGMLQFNEYIGWSDGILTLLESVGIEAEPV